MATNIFRIAFGIWFVSIITASLIDYSNISLVDVSTKGGSGLVYHFGAYLIGAALSWIVLRKSSIKIIAIIGIILFVLGVVLEVAQIFVPGRTFNLMDIAANALGLGTFYLCLMVWMFIKGVIVNSQPKSVS